MVIKTSKTGNMNSGIYYVIDANKVLNETFYKDTYVGNSQLHTDPTLGVTIMFLVYEPFS